MFLHGGMSCRSTGPRCRGMWPVRKVEREEEGGAGAAERQHGGAAGCRGDVGGLVRAEEEGCDAAPALEVCEAVGGDVRGGDAVESWGEEEGMRCWS